MFILRGIVHSDNIDLTHTVKNFTKLLRYFCAAHRILMTKFLLQLEKVKQIPAQICSVLQVLKMTEKVQYLIGLIKPDTDQIIVF